ncbi:MAG: DUF5996 family protein [Parasphingopyxis sp.]|uniref:DUF5996 family protein n=1 Tax=Parasphingopyxis sp. TaxID=1920299 RepID=UPI003F9F1651
MNGNRNWPELAVDNDGETFAMLHLMTQIVGKTRVALTPWSNHSWHVPLYLTARGLGSSPIDHPDGSFDLEFDLIGSQLTFRGAGGATDTLPLESGTIAGFFSAFNAMLARHGVATAIHGTPNEIPDPTPFAEDDARRNYDPDAARRLWQALLRIDTVFKHFATGFLGKTSPVHFFWGSFDLAVTRFSGREAPEHPGGVPALPDDVAREAYSHEVSSAGFWPGNADAPDPIFYSYAYPEPDGFRDADGLPEGASYNKDLGEYVLPYAAVRAASDPEALLLDFLQKTYDAAADAGNWDRAALDCELGEPRKVRRYA